MMSGKIATLGLLKINAIWRYNFANKISSRVLNKKNLYSPFIWMMFNCLKAEAISRR